MSYMRGFGRGRGAPADVKTKSTTPGASAAEKRFQEASKLHSEAAEKHLQHSKVSKPVEPADKVHNDDELLKKITASYIQNGSGGADEVIDTNSLFDVVMNEDSSVCLICLDSIERSEAIWNCPSCYCIIHMECIKQWIREGAYQQKLNTLSEEHFPNRKVPWHCPKCRTEYPHSDTPSVYRCFCGKADNPTDDPWLLPHSCGETCHRPLKPQCGHQCLLLCHPGGCPPCPKSVKVACYCGQRAPVPRRCGAKSWSCGEKCKKILKCGQHKCSSVCHNGECKPCAETSLQSCECGKENQSRPCAQPTWSCGQRCDKMLPCGYHYCKKVCHKKGDCGQCERSAQTRLCPCGKSSSHNLHCTEDVPCCGDTCGKPLSCGIHQCTEKCHNDNCSQCLQVSVKSCRCGAKQKELPCAKPFTCDTRCQKMKSCGRHMCKRRCCDGTSCTTCDQICGKKLKCGNHKCTSVCHDGPCYPCTITVDKACNCGKTVVSVPCIRQKTAQPPRCRRPCLHASKCDHLSIQKHACHFASCPPCTLVCGKQLAGCNHSCTNRCHDAVNVKIQLEKKVLAGPWEQQAPTYTTIERKPCPPCPQPCTVVCKGKHESSEVPCHSSKIYSCSRECGRTLSCTNHVCALECHLVTPKNNAQGDSNVAGEECESCELGCGLPRLEGCTHSCLKPCHPGTCPPCKQAIKSRCHCAVTVLYIPCHEWTDPQFSKDERLRCPGLCPKELSCGHPCSLPCHPTGKCQQICAKKVTLRCKCKTMKQSVACNLVGQTQIECGERCNAAQQSHNTDTDQGSQSEAVEEDVDPSLMLPGRRQRKRKERQISESTSQSSLPWRSIRKYSLVIGALLAVVLAFYLAITAED